MAKRGLGSLSRLCPGARNIITMCRGRMPLGAGSSRLLDSMKDSIVNTVSLMHSTKYENYEFQDTAGAGLTMTMEIAFETCERTVAVDFWPRRIGRVLLS